MSPSCNFLLFLSILFFTAVVSQPCPSHPAPVPLPSPLPSNIQKALDKTKAEINLIMKHYYTTQASVGIIFEGEVIYQHGFSTLDNVTSDEHTLYRIGSLSKVVTDTMLMHTRDLGKVRLDEPVSKYWPNFGVNNPFSNPQGITFRELATQLSGLAGGSPCVLYPACNSTTEEVFEQMNLEDYVISPTDYYPHYSDGAYSVLARALERPLGMTFEDYCTSILFPALGMNSTGWSFPEEVIQRMAEPRLGEFPIGPKIAYLDFLWDRPTGGLYSSVHDLLRFVQMFIKASDKKATAEELEKLPISASYLREMQLISYVNDDAASGFGFPFEWYYLDAIKGWFVTKGGLVPGYSAILGFIPKLQYGCIGLSNSFLGTTICDLYTANVVPEIYAYLSEHQPAIPNPGNLTSFVGKYFLNYPPLPTIDSTVDIVLTSEGNALNFTLGSSTQVLHWYRANLFVIQLTTSLPCFNSEVSQAGEIVAFQTNKTGDVVSLSTPATEPYWGQHWKKIQSRN